MNRGNNNYTISETRSANAIDAVPIADRVFADRVFADRVFADRVSLIAFR